MYVYIYIYIYIYTHTHTHTHIYIYIYIYIASCYAKELAVFTGVVLFKGLVRILTVHMDTEYCPEQNDPLSLTEMHCVAVTCKTYLYILLE